MAKKYDWGDDTKIAIRHFIEKVSNYKPSGNAGDDAIVFLAYIADARCIRLKLDPRPNFRKADVCMDCTDWYPCDSEKALGTCDNFTREAEEPAVIFNDCNNCTHGDYQCDGIYVYDKVKCPNFKKIEEAEEPDGSVCDFGRCYFGEVECSSRNTNSTCDHQIAYSMACDNFTGEKAAGLCTSCMRVHICSVANDEITLCGSYKKPTL